MRRGEVYGKKNHQCTEDPIPDLCCMSYKKKQKKKNSKVKCAVAHYWVRLWADRSVPACPLWSLLL